MAMQDFVAFELFVEPIVAVKASDKIFYMNLAAKKLFGEKYIDSDATLIFDRRLLMSKGELTTGTFMYKKRSYIATLVKINGFRTIVTRPSKPGAQIKSELDNVFVEPMMSIMKYASANINSRINSIKLKRFRLTEESLRTNVAILDHSASAMTRLITHIDYLTSEIDNDLEIEMFDLYDCIAELTTMAGLLCENKLLTLNFKPDSETASFYGCKRNICIMLLNVLSNSIKHSPNGSIISVRAKQEDDGLFEITVTDSGSGIPPEQRALLFKPFAARESSEYYEGAGLGLAVVKKAAEYYNGSVFVSSSTFGTSVTVTLRSIEPKTLQIREPRPATYDLERLVLVELSDAVDIQSFIEKPAASEE